VLVCCTKKNLATLVLTWRKEATLTKFYNIGLCTSKVQRAGVVYARMTQNVTHFLRFRRILNEKRRAAPQFFYGHIFRILDCSSQGQCRKFAWSDFEKKSMCAN
jgi:hypothetical protein